jgi:SAM-dependent methyltransferase
MGYEKSAHLYDLFDTKENINFFTHYGIECGEILDIGAGTGRIAVPMTLKGVKVCCVESSPAMIREFERKLAEKLDLSKNITIIRSDASSFKIDHFFPCAILSGTIDHLLNDTERLSVLKNIANHLSRDGMLVFDIFTGLMKESKPHPAGSMKIGEREYRRFVGSKLISKDKMVVSLNFDIYENGKLIERIEERSMIGVINREQIHSLLHRSGFDIKREFGDYDFRKYRPGDRLLIIEAAKR